MNIILIIIVLILIFLIYKKTRIENFEDIQVAQKEYNDKLRKMVLEKFILNNMSIQGTRTFSDLCNYFHSDDDHLILPTDTIIDGTLESNDILVTGDCELSGEISIDNLTVKGNVYIKNKDNTYSLAQIGTDTPVDLNFTPVNSIFNVINTPPTHKYLDILPKGSIILWSSKNTIPYGWVLLNLEYNKYNNACFVSKNIKNIFNDEFRIPLTDYIRIPPLNNMYVMGSDIIDSNPPFYITGNERKLHIDNIPQHSHKYNLGSSTICWPNNEYATPCSINNKIGNMNKNLTRQEQVFKGNDNFIYSHEKYDKDLFLSYKGTDKDYVYQFMKDNKQKDYAYYSITINPPSIEVLYIMKI